jgi:hypothetical protein
MINPITEKMSDEEKEKQFKSLGRVACVKFQNPLDALSILTKQVEVTLPLNDGTNNEPVIVASRNLLDVKIPDLTSKLQTAALISFQDAGRLFSNENKKIQSITAEIKSILIGGGAKDKRRKRFRKKGAPAPGGSVAGKTGGKRG